MAYAAAECSCTPFESSPLSGEHCLLTASLTVLAVARCSFALNSISCALCFLVCASRQDCNQRLRDHETRDNAAKVLRHISMWQVPVKSGLAALYGRNEVAPSTIAARVPEMASLAKMFVPRVRKNEADMTKLSPGPKKIESQQDTIDEKLKRVTGAQDWVTTNSETKAEMVAEWQLLCHLHKTEAWQTIDDMWRAKLLPQHELVQDTRNGQIYWVVRAFAAGVLLWIAQELSDSFWSLRMTGDDLHWAFIADIEVWRILPIECTSPLHQVLRGAPSSPQVAWRVQGAAQSVLEWHTENGFPYVPEAVLRLLTRSCGAEVPDETKGVDYATELKLTMMKQVALAPKTHTYIHTTIKETSAHRVSEESLPPTSATTTDKGQARHVERRGGHRVADRLHQREQGRLLRVEHPPRDGAGRCDDERAERLQQLH